MLVAPSQRAFAGVSALLFAASAWLTIARCGAMSAMPAMPMSGGWAMSMMWMRTPGQSWPGAASAFLGMWFVMMLAMMLPSLVPVLWRYRRALATTGAARRDTLTALVGGAYFLVWTLFGAMAFLAGTTLTAIEMRFPLLARAAPMAIGAIVWIAGMLQFGSWKLRHLACCRNVPGCCGVVAGDAGAAWRLGVRMGVHCVHCCFGLTVVLLVVGMMDLRAMAAVTAAISAERLAPDGARTARVVGAVCMAAGVLLVARAALFV